MKLVTDTPLRAAWRPWCFAPGDWRLVVVVKATLELPCEGAATLADEQAFVTGDTFWDEDPERSVRYDDDLALLKPEGEWWITGTLRAPSPSTELACFARVGERSVRFDVIGDRWWQPDGSASSPVPFTEMPLRWERSFGGPGLEANPLGRGIAPDPSDTLGRVALPNIERHGRLIRSPNERPEPAGAWPIPRSWPERVRLTGTYDAAYLRERWPYFADDFSWRYFQAAREPQRVRGYFRGDEEIELANLHPVFPRLRCTLPSIRPRVFVHERARPQGPLREVGLVLDTIAIDAGAEKAFVLWRGSTSCSGEAFEGDFAHLYVTHEPLGRPRSESDHFAAFIAHLRARWEEERALEAEPTTRPRAHAAPEPSRAGALEAPDASSARDVIAAGRQEAIGQGMPEALAYELYPAIDPASAPSRAQLRAQLEANVGVAEQLASPELVERFLEEIALAKQLRHSNIVAVYDHGEDRGHFYVMELIDGMDLGNLLHRSGPLSPELVVLLGTELAKALIYVHHSDSQTGRKPLVHCDVTPHNVLIGRDGAVKLSDFGIAKALRKTGAETITRARGKPWYLSPEQWEGGKVGAHSDLFSLGLVLWRALVGTHPYAEGRPSDVMLETWIRERTLANARERTVAEAAPGAPPALQEVIEGLLQLPPKRTRAAEQVWNALLPLRPIDGSAKLAELISEVAAGGHR